MVVDLGLEHNNNIAQVLEQSSSISNFVSAFVQNPDFT
jgi:hypothetical protein